jgi:hypothetical protein
MIELIQKRLLSLSVLPVIVRENFGKLVCRRPWVQQLPGVAGRRLKGELPSHHLVDPIDLEVCSVSALIHRSDSLACVPLHPTRGDQGLYLQELQSVAFFVADVAEVDCRSIWESTYAVLAMLFSAPIAH